jgi:RNA polymerase sigma-70 factor (ECF subfamily)
VESSNSLERSLESELGWMRALALKLVADASEADDLVQEALLTALRARPELRGAGSARRWLGRVLALRAQQAWRTQRRRREREERAAHADTAQDASEIAALFEAQRALHEAVYALAEPYRSVVMLRYFEGLTPAQIAARRGVPAATVRSQLLRAHEQLRAALDRRHGGDARAWSVAFLPLALDRSALSQAAWLGSPLVLLALMLKPWIALALAVVCSIGIWRWTSNTSDIAPTATAAAADAPTVPEVEVEQRSNAAARVEGERNDVAHAPIASESPRPALLRGRVVDAGTRQPLSDLELRVVQRSMGLEEFVSTDAEGREVRGLRTAGDAEEFVRTDADGRFECSTPFAAGTLRIGGADRVGRDSHFLYSGQSGGAALDVEQSLSWNGRDELEVEFQAELFVPLVWSAPVSLTARDLLAQLHLQDPDQGELCIQTPIRGDPSYARFPPMLGAAPLSGSKLLRVVSRDGLWRGEALTPIPRPAPEGPLRIELLASGKVVVELGPSPIPKDTVALLRRLPKGPAQVRGENERERSEGRSEFGGLEGGEYELDVRAEGFERVARQVVVTPGRVNLETITLAPLGAPVAIRGEVRTRSGQANESTALSLMSTDLSVAREIFPEWVERDGRWCAPFEFAELPAGTYRLRVTAGPIARAWSGAALEFSAPAEGVVLTCDDLAPTERLELQLFDAQTAEPITEGFVGVEAGLAWGAANRQPAMHVWVIEHAAGLEVQWGAGGHGYETARGTNRAATLVDGMWRLRVELQRAAK